MNNAFSKIESIFRFRRLYTLLLPCVCILTLFSCEEILDVNLSGDATQILVVEGSITTDTLSHKVILSFTDDFFKKPEKIMATGAEVTISDGSKTFLLHEEDAGVYITDDTVHGEIGKTYTLNIKLTDDKQYTASDYLNPCADFDSISQTLNYNSLLSGYGYNVLFYGKEPEPAGNYYMFLVYKDNVLYSDTITEAVVSDDEFINGIYIRDYPVFRIRETDLQDYPARITLEMLSVSQQFYDFMIALMTETVWKGSPWDCPPANIPSNISNGGMGYFRASDVKRHSRMFYPSPRMN
jgi:hypothetical protein